MLFRSEDIHKSGNKLSFTPNTITYDTDADSAHGKAIKHSKLGVVVHTKYEGKGDLDKMRATPHVDREKFTHHPDVHNIDPTIKVDPSQYTHKEQQNFHDSMAKAKALYAKMHPDALDKLKGHGTNLEAHINDMVRKGGKASTEGFVKHETARIKKDMDNVKKIGRAHV